MLKTDGKDMMLDLRERNVEVKVSEDGKTLWVNTPHSCVLRIQNIKSIELENVREASMMKSYALGEKIHMLLKFVKKIAHHSWENDYREEAEEILKKWEAK